MNTRPGGLGCISMGMAAIIRDFLKTPPKKVSGPGKTTKTSPTLWSSSHGSRHGKPAGKPALKPSPIEV